MFIFIHFFQTIFLIYMFFWTAVRSCSLTPFDYLCIFFGVFNPLHLMLLPSNGSLKKQESSRKTSISTLLTMPNPLTVWITTNCGKFFKGWEYQTT